MKRSLLPPLALLFGFIINGSAPAPAAPKSTTAKPSTPKGEAVPAFLGRELIFAAAYTLHGGSARTAMEIGRLEFLPGKTFRASRLIFDPMANPEPSPNARREPYTGKNCVSQKIRVPSYQRSDDFTGSWEFTGDKLTLSGRDIAGRQGTQIWDLKKRDKKLFALTASETRGMTLVNGYAYVSENKTEPATPSGTVRLRDAYTGQLHQRVIANGADWKPYPWGFTIASYQRTTANLYKQYQRTADGKISGFATLTFNAFRYSRNIFLQTFGTDFNKNECFDDGGHSALFWGAEDDKGFIRGAVLIEQSRGPEAAIVSVGQVD